MKIFTAFVLSAFIVCFAAAGLWATTYGKVRSGNNLYKKNEYDKSLDKYREAEISSPDNPVVYFNIGDSLHKTGKYDESNTEYSRALNSKDKLMRSKVYYNMGNNAVAQEKTDEAVNDYIKALQLNPRDMDAKYNLEYLLNRKNLQKNKKNDKNDKNGKGKEEKAKASAGKDKNGKDKNEQKKNSMSKEDAQRILQYYNDQEKKNAEKRKMQTPSLPKTDEDW